MYKKILASMLLLSFSNSFLVSYTLPKKCDYLRTKSSKNMDKSDMYCFIQMGAVKMNEQTPKTYGNIFRQDNAIPKSKSLLINFTILDENTFKKSYVLKMKKKSLSTTCNNKYFKFFLNYGLELDYRFYNTNKKLKYSFIVNQKTCSK